MRLPINFVLHLTWTGLLGLAGWTFYQTLPQGTWSAHQQSHDKGLAEARDLLNKDKPDTPVTTAWNYDSKAWMDRWMAPNLLGKDPPKPEVTGPVVDVKPETPVDRRPIKEIIELVTVMHEATPDGEGALSHVVVRYKDGIDVHPPIWYQRENAAQAAGGATARDSVPLPPQPAVPGGARGRRGGGQGRPATPAPATPLPVSSAGQEIVQRVWATGDGSPKFEASLWPPFDNIRLVKVAPDALSATFERTLPPAKEGEPPPPPDQEEVYKGSDFLSPEARQMLTEVHRDKAARIAAAQAANPAAPVASTSQWVDVKETQKMDNIYQVARKESAEELQGQVNAETYTSRTGGSLRGVVIRNISQAVAARFGVLQNDVILAVNGEAVSTKSEAIALGKRLYERGVRTFVVRFLSNGQEIERTYQLPDR